MQSTAAKLSSNVQPRRSPRVEKKRKISQTQTSVELKSRAALYSSDVKSKRAKRPARLGRELCSSAQRPGSAASDACATTAAEPPAGLTCVLKCWTSPWHVMLLRGYATLQMLTESQGTRGRRGISSLRGYFHFGGLTADLLARIEAYDIADMPDICLDEKAATALPGMWTASIRMLADVLDHVNSISAKPTRANGQLFGMSEHHALFTARSWTEVRALAFRGLHLYREESEPRCISGEEGMVTVCDELVKTLLAEMYWQGRCSMTGLRADCECALRRLMTLYAASDLTHAAPDEYSFRAVGHENIYRAIRALVTEIGWLCLSDTDVIEQYALFAADATFDSKSMAPLQPAIDRASAVMHLCTPPAELSDRYQLAAYAESAQVHQRTAHHGLDLAAYKLPVAQADYIGAMRATWIAHWEEYEELITIVDLPAALGFDEAAAYVGWAMRHLKTRDGFRVGTEQAEWHVANCGRRPLKRLWWPDQNLDLVMAALLVFESTPSTTTSCWNYVLMLTLVLLFGMRGYGWAEGGEADDDMSSLELC